MYLSPHNQSGQKAERRRLLVSHRVGQRTCEDRAAFAVQMRAVARQSASVAWDECAEATGLGGEALAELLDSNPYRRVAD
jgi:hypothetical protein